MEEQKATMASSNIATSSSTVLNLVSDEKLNGEISALNTLKDATRKSDSYLDVAQKYYNEASLNSYKSKFVIPQRLFSLTGKVSDAYMEVD